MTQEIYKEGVTGIPDGHLVVPNGRLAIPDGRFVLPFSDDDVRQNVNSLLETTLGPDFDPGSFDGYPYTSSAIEPTTPQIDAVRKRFIQRLLELEDSQPGLGHAVWCSSENLRRLSSEDNATYRALDRVYSGPDARLETSETALLLAHLGLILPNNARGARNRKRIVEQEVEKTIAEFPLVNGNRLNFLSVAAGSGRAVMEAIKRSGMTNRIDFTMLDLDPQAETDGKALAKEFGIGESVHCITGDAFKPHKHLVPNKRYVKIEGVGFYDYWRHKTCVILTRIYREHLVPGGKLLFANITQNDETDWLKRPVGWKEMREKTAEELREIAIEAGFDEKNIERIPEPTGTYNFIIAIK